MPVEDELAAFGMKGDLEDAVLLAIEAGIGEGMAVGLEAGHRADP
jgi:hypothetical protein